MRRRQQLLRLSLVMIAAMVVVQETWVRVFGQEAATNGSGVLFEPEPDKHSHSLPVVAVEFSPDRKYLASAAPGDDVLIWDVGTGRCVHAFDGASTLTRHIRFRPTARVTFLAVATVEYSCGTQRMER